MTGPFTTNIPGIFSAGEMSMAERLGWPLKGFRQAFQELFRKGLVKADWDAPLVWLPNSIKYNHPENPNVVKGWGVVWDELPECSIKADCYQHFKEFIEGLGKGFQEAFLKGFAKPLVKGLAKQEQEQEQEQEQLKEKNIKKKNSKTPVPEFFQLTEEMIFFAEKQGVKNVEEATEQFQDHFRANGETKVDWMATWRNWMRNHLKFNRSLTSRGKHGEIKASFTGIPGKSWIDIKRDKLLADAANQIQTEKPGVDAIDIPKRD